MSPCANNGRLASSQLHPIPNGRLQKDAADAWNDLRAYIIKQGGPAIDPAGPISSYRDLAGQNKMRIYWCNQGQCYKAAVPGTSNHGCGVAVDAKPAGWAWLLRYGPRFGWSHAEGARVGEAWHFTYVGGYHAKRKVDPLTRRERKWVNEYVALKRRNKDRGRRRVLRRYMRRQRQEIWRNAEGTKNGWKHAHRKERYAILRRYS